MTTTPKPRPIGPIPPFRLAPGTKAFEDRLQEYYRDEDGQLLVQAIIDRHAAKRAGQHHGLVPVRWKPEPGVVVHDG
jgi:hypothetical protein